MPSFLRCMCLFRQLHELAVHFKIMGLSGPSSFSSRLSVIGCSPCGVLTLPFFSRVENISSKQLSRRLDVNQTLLNFFVSTSRRLNEASAFSGIVPSASVL